MRASITEEIISATQKIATKATLALCKETEGLMDVSGNTAKDLDNSVKLVSDVVESVMIARYGS